jgi:hypothetical protein
VPHSNSPVSSEGSSDTTAIPPYQARRVIQSWLRAKVSAITYSNAAKAATSPLAAQNPSVGLNTVGPTRVEPLAWERQLPCTRVQYTSILPSSPTESRRKTRFPDIFYYTNHGTTIFPTVKRYSRLAMSLRLAGMEYKTRKAAHR